jgi:hypothetical protein
MVPYAMIESPEVKEEVRRGVEYVVDPRIYSPTRAGPS